MTKFKIGISPCPNDTFIFRDMIQKRIKLDGLELEFEYADVQTLNERALLGYYDMVKISFGQLPNVIHNYKLLPCGGALGRNCGPLLIGQNNDLNLDLAKELEIVLPGKNTTARHLFDFWAAKQGLNVKREFGFFDEIYSDLVSKNIENGVVIHESRFTYAKDGLKCLVDLGAFWEEQTESPIPLGGIILKNEHKDRSPQIIEAIKESIKQSYENPDVDFEFFKEMAQISDSQVVRDHIKLYVNDFSVEMGEEGFKAIDFLMEHLTGENGPKRKDWLISE